MKAPGFAGGWLLGYFGAHKPARSTTEARLMVDAKVEIDVVGYRPV